MSDLQYRLNGRDEISWVSEEWIAFARANQGAALLPSRVLGRPLWDFITDPETQHIYRQLHRLVRTRGVPVRVSFRCDAPERRRFLTLEISESADQGLAYSVRTVREQDREPMTLLDPRLPRSASFVTMCGWCKRVLGPLGDWLELEAAVTALSLFAEPLPPQLTHGICQGCSQGLHQALGGDAIDPVLGRL